jgi:hypothetical protein
MWCHCLVENFHSEMWSWWNATWLVQILRELYPVSFHCWSMCESIVSEPEVQWWNYLLPWIKALTHMKPRNPVPYELNTAYSWFQRITLQTFFILFRSMFLKLYGLEEVLSYLDHSGLRITGWHTNFQSLFVARQGIRWFKIQVEETKIMGKRKMKL